MTLNTNNESNENHELTAAPNAEAPTDSLASVIALFFQRSVLSSVIRDGIVNTKEADNNWSVNSFDDMMSATSKSKDSPSMN